MAYDNQVQWHMIIKVPLQLLRGVPNSSLLRGLTIIEYMGPLFSISINLFKCEASVLWLKHSYVS